MPSDDFLISFGDESSVAVEVEGDPTFAALAEAVQLLVQTEQSWTIHVANGVGMSGVVGTTPGRVCYARAGMVRGKEAFLQLMSWSDGRIERQTTAAQPDEIEDDLPKLLMEAYWYAVEHQGEVKELARTVEIEASHLRDSGSIKLAPALLAKVGELEGVEGFLALGVYQDGKLVKELGDRSLSTVEAYTTMRTFWRAMDIEAQDAVLRHPAHLHIVRHVGGLDVHVTLDRRRVNFAMAIFKVRSLLS